MRKVLLVNTSLQPPGGGNAVAAWMVEALKGYVDLTTLTWERVECVAVNCFYGTALKANEFESVVVSQTSRILSNVLPFRCALLKTALLARQCRMLLRSRRFDVVISAGNEIDFGLPGIQYVHFPSGHLPRPKADLRWYHAIPGTVRLYHKLCEVVNGGQVNGVKRNLTLVNSDYVGKVYRDLYGPETSPVTVYPPVRSMMRGSGTRREEAFVCVGRFSPEKELEKVVRIVSALRADGTDVRLHIAGTQDIRSYGRRIAALAGSADKWIEIHEDLAPDALSLLLSRCKYGIHGMVGEHFGIAVAEMVNAGLIVFASDKGGPAEILAHDERLLYTSEPDAVRKIRNVMSSQKLRDELVAILAKRQNVFSCETFVKRIREAVDSFRSE